MKYTNLTCEACGVVFREEDDVVVCPVCGAPHHRTCWDAANHCVHEAQHSTGFAWTAPKTAVQQDDHPGANQEKAASKGETMENGEGIVVCEKCGSRNFENDAFCLRCGAPLHPENSAARGSNEFRRYPSPEEADASAFRRPTISDEMLQSFRRYGGLAPHTELDGIPVCEYADFVGGGSPGKIIRKISTMERYGKKLSFLIPAFLFGPVWFMYRKMRKEGWIVGMVLILLCLFSGLMQINDAYVSFTKNTASIYTEMLRGNLSQSDVIEKIQQYTEDYANAQLPQSVRMRAAFGEALYYFAVLGVPLYCGLRGLQHYRNKIKHDIHQIRAECSDMQSYQRMLLAEGGTSAGGALIGVLIVMTALACYTYVPVLLSLLYF